MKSREDKICRVSSAACVYACERGRGVEKHTDTHTHTKTQSVEMFHVWKHQRFETPWRQGPEQEVGD